MFAYLVAVATERRADPRGDVVSALATAAPGGDQLSDAELAMFLVQLLVAGNETTRNLLSGGLAALGERPGEWARLRARPLAGPPGGGGAAALDHAGDLVPAHRHPRHRAGRPADRRRRARAARLRLGQPRRGGLRVRRPTGSTWAATPTRT